MNEPVGRRGSFTPDRARMMASATACTASSWPTTRSCSTSSRRSSFSRSPSVSRATGMPVHAETISAISSVGDHLAQQPVLALLVGEPVLLGRELALQLGQLP